MSTLRELTTYLTTLPFIERDHFEASQVDESELILSMTCVDAVNGVHLLYREVYDAVLYFEAWVQPKELILSHIAAWLLEHGGDRDADALGSPIIEPLKNDDNSHDLMVTIRFQECVYAIPDPAGDLNIMGKTWKRCLWLPETAEVFDVTA